jgi:hypothetical protein
MVGTSELTDANLIRVAVLVVPEPYRRLPPPQLGFAGFDGHAQAMTSAALAEPPPLNTR